MAPSFAARTAALGAVLVASGAAALAFETLWFHQASLGFGNSVWASSLVLTGFMLGMAFGGQLAARYADRPRRPARAYAVLELLVGLCGVALVVALPALGAHLAPLASVLSEWPVLLNIARFGAAFLLLLVPSTAIGASLPIVLRALGGEARTFGSSLGLLYGLNTFGAVLGVLATELWLLPAFGVRGSSLAALGCSLLAAAGAWFSPEATQRDPSPTPAPSAKRLVITRLLVASFGSGLLLLALEVVWLRFLMLFLNDTPLVFAIVLVVVLIGIAAGSVIAGALLAASPRRAAYAPLVAYAAGLGGFGGYLAYPSFLQRFLTFDPSAPAAFAVCAPLILPTAIASGALYTLLGAGLRRVAESDAYAAGRLAFANTLGAGLGAWLGGFVLLPYAGMERSLFGLLLGYGVVGLLLGSARELGVWYRRGAIAIFLGAFALFPFGKVERVFVSASAGRWMTSDDRIVAVREGLTATTVHIRHRLAGLPLFDQLATNAYSMSVNDFAARRYMQLYVYLPAAVHPRIRRALVVGYGIGNTAAALVDQHEIERIDVADISHDILEMSRAVAPRRAHHPLDDQRVKVHLEDGRYFLQMTAQRFDLITGEPPPPVMAGVGSLYSREYFELVHSRLEPGGFASYWLPMMNLSAASARSIIAGFCAAFEDCSLWHGSARNFMLIGSRGARTTVGLTRFTAQFRDPVSSKELTSIGFELPEQLGAAFIGDASYLAQLTRDTPPLTDDQPKRMHQAIDPEQRDALIWQWRDTAAARARFETSPLVGRLFPPAIRIAALRQFENQRLLDDLLFPGPTPARQTRVLHQVLHGTRLRLPILLLLGSDPDIQRALAAAPPALRDREQFRIHLAAGRLADRDLRGALELLERIPDKDLPLPDLRSYLREAIARTSAEGEKGTD